MKMKMTPIEAARAIKKHVDPETCRKLPRSALEMAIRAVCCGQCPAGVAASIEDAAS
jgi:hypothetical protein